MAEGLLVAAGLGTAFAFAAAVTARIGQVYALVALFAAAWVLHGGDPGRAILDGAVPAFLAVSWVDAIRLARPASSPVVGLATQDRRRAVDLLSEHHPRELVG